MQEAKHSTDCKLGAEGSGWGNREGNFTKAVSGRVFIFGEGWEEGEAQADRARWRGWRRCLEMIAWLRWHRTEVTSWSPRPDFACGMHYLLEFTLTIEKWWNLNQNLDF